MTSMIAICLAFSFFTALILVPCVRFVAHKIGMVDDPDAERKLHHKPIALGGGVAVFAALAATFSAVVIYDRYVGDFSLGYLTTQWYGLFFAAGAMLVVGLVDDLWSLRGRQKLLLQILIISAVIGTGTVVDKIGLFGSELYLGALGYPVTMLWLLVAVNALNLIDGADGMATTAGSIISLGLAFLSLQHGLSLNVVVALALAGSLLAFLVFNRPPASIFLGDAGSMMIGLFIGVLAVWSHVKESTVLASAPVAILAIPLFDSSAAVIRRWLTGRSIYATDRGHLHHLLAKKFGPQRMLLVVAGLCSFTTVLAVLSTRYELPLLAGLGVACVITILVCTRSFGHAECRLLLGKSLNVVRSFLVAPHNCPGQRQQTRVPLQGSGNWDTVWEPLVEFAKTHDLAKVNIDLSLSWLHEGYHATWTSVRLPERAFQLSVRMPLFALRAADHEQVSIGRLEIIAPASDPTAYEKISDLSDKLVDLGPQIDAIIADLERQDRELRQDGEELVAPVAKPAEILRPEPVSLTAP